MELFRVLACLAETPTPAHAAAAQTVGLGALPDQAAYTDCFLFQFYPYASIYLGPEGMLGGVARDRIGGFWRALGLTPPNEPDHLAVMLAFYASLAEHENTAHDATQQHRWRTAQHAYLWEHLLPWLPAYLSRIQESGPDFYQRWAALVQEVLVSEWETIETPGQLPLHLREAPPIPGVDGFQLDQLMSWLLTPLNSGIILARQDCVEAASTLGLGLRTGDRRLMLRTLLEQDTAKTLGWLAQEARRWETRHRQLPGGPIAVWWGERSHSAAQFLDTLQHIAQTQLPHATPLSHVS